MSAAGGDLIDLSDETAPTASSTGPYAQGRKGSIAEDADGQPLERSTTRDSQASTGGGKDNAGTLSNLLSNTMTFFGRKRGSISAADGADYSNSPSSTSPTALRNGSPASSNIALPQSQFAGNSPASTSAGLPSQPGARSSAENLPQGAAIPRGASAIARPRGSTTSTAQNSISTAGASSFSQPSASSSTTAPSGSTTSSSANPAASAIATQARLRTLPRLDSYKVDKQKAPVGSGAGDSLSRIDSRDSEAGGDDGNDTTTSMSGTETEQETEGTETDEDEDEGDEDEEDDDHTEADVRGGLQRTLQRPALPTLSSTRGFSRNGMPTPFQTPQAPAVYNGWTTFGTSTPTPGPLRTARPTPGDNAPNVSYFDARPTSGRKTPAQTPKALASDSPARSYRSPTQPRTPGSAMSPQQRMRLESRPSGMPHSRQASTPSSVPSPVTTVTGQSIPASAIPSIPTSGQPASPTRPSFYQRQSRSLVDLSRSLDPEDLTSPAPNIAPARRDESVQLQQADSGIGATTSASSLQPPPAAVMSEGSGKEAAAALPQPNSPPPAQPQTQDAQPPKSVQRRQSMPEMRLDPPLYSIDDDFFVQYRKDVPMPVSREEEGHEPLPVYSCDVHIEGYVPRKMEFLKPGVQAKDRRWKRQYIILHGTSIKIYRSDPRSKPVAGEEAPPSPGVHKADLKPDFGSNVAGKRSAASAAASSSSTRARSSTQASRMSTSSGTSALSSSTSSTVASTNSEKIAPSAAAGKTVSAANSRVFDPDVPVHVHVQDEDEGALATLQHPTHLISKAGDNRVIRHYTLQGAESGLAADYLKRRHVVRIRAEGEQFLVQAKDDRNVIDWIEALQAATNTALDLDVRPLPKFITLPRRRRRRPRPDGAAAPATNAAGAAAGSAPSSAAASSTAQRDRMNNMLAEDQENYLARPGGMVS